MQKLDSITKLIDYLRDTFRKKALDQLEFRFIDQLKDIPVSSILTDEVYVVSIIEEAVDPCNIGMIQKVIYLDFSEHIFNNVQLNHFPFF